MKFLPQTQLKKRKSNTAFIIPFILFFLTIFTFPVSGELLSDAVSAEGDGDYERAFSLYSTWLEENTAHRDYYSVLIHTAEISPLISNAVELLKHGLELNPSDDIKSRLYGLYADVLEMSGRLEETVTVLKQHYDLGDEHSLASLLRAAVLEFELGKTAEAEKAALIAVNNGVASDIILDASFLLSRIYMASGREERGFSVLASLTDSSVTVKHIKPEYLYALIVYAGRHERTEAEAAARRKLEKYFPHSIYTHLLETPGDLRIHLMPNPDIFFSTEEGRENSETDTPENTMNPAEKKPAFVQTGSFSDKENAEYMKRDLENDGFCAVIKKAQLSGERYYQVLVPLKQHEAAAADCSTEGSPETVLIRLKEKGFEGFFIY